MNPLRQLREAWSRRREAAALARRPIPDLLWRRTLRRFPFLVDGPGRDEARLRRMTSLFLDRKEFSGAHGLEVTDDMAVAIAAQACLPVLHIGLAAYDRFVGIVVHPGAARVYRERVDEAGVVHAGDEELAGEAQPGGPVMLSWRDVRASGASAPRGYNVVIHEFAHVLDLADGAADGEPPLPPDIEPAEWRRTLREAYDLFCEQVDRDEETVLDPYGSQSLDEFFAVASEGFFVNREAFAPAHPALDALLARYYRFPAWVEPTAETERADAGGVGPSESLVTTPETPAAR
jgi:hypothetical protein